VRCNLCIYPARCQNQAHSALADEDPTTWFDKGKQIEEMLAKQNNLDLPLRIQEKHSEINDDIQFDNSAYVTLRELITKEN
jgi:hypothetical protein